MARPFPLSLLQQSLDLKCHHKLQQALVSPPNATALEKSPFSIHTAQVDEVNLPDLLLPSL